MRRLPTVDHRPNDDRLFVKVFVQGTGKVFWTVALVDTGATGIVASPLLARRARAKVVPCPSEPLWSSTRRHQCPQAALLIVCGPATCRAIISVLPKWGYAPGAVPHELVFGWEWIESFGAVIDSARRTISVREWRTRDIM